MRLTLRTICSFALSLFALTASAEPRLLVLRPDIQGSAGQEGISANIRYTRHNILKYLGINFDEIPQSRVGTTSVNGPQQVGIRTGVINYTGGANPLITTYVAVWHTDFLAFPRTARSTGYNPDTLTTLAGWASIPSMFTFYGQSPQSDKWRTASGCTTGVANTTGGQINADYDAGLSIQVVGRPDLVWHPASTTSSVALNATFYYNNASNRSLKINHAFSGITKSRMIVGGNAVAFNDNGFTSAANPDSMTKPTDWRDATADTTCLWTRERNNGAYFSANRDTAMQVWVMNNSNETGGGDDWHVIMGLCILDSTVFANTGQHLIGQARGWVPPTVAFGISGAFTHSPSSVVSTSDWNTHGTQYPSDTTLTKLACDSLDALRIPLLVTVNIDSVGSYPSEKSWWSRIKMARFSPESRVGVGLGPVNPPLGGRDGFASRYFSPDIWGYNRTRDYVSADRYDNGTVCDGADTTISCMLAYARARLDSIPEFRGRMSSTLIAPQFDYIPLGRTRNFMPNPDSLAVAILRSGYTTVVGGQMYAGEISPSITWGNSAAGDIVTSTSEAPRYPRGWSYSQRSPVGTLSWLMSRTFDEIPDGVIGAGHDFAAENAHGLVNTPWYSSNLQYWYHNLRAPIRIVLARPGELGYFKTATSNATRPGYNQIKWIVNQIRAANYFAGFPVIKIVYPEEVSPSW